MAVDIPESIATENLLLTQQLGRQNVGALQRAGEMTIFNAETVRKALDYDYLENKRMVTLDEAIGVREVQSEVSPGGPRKPAAS